jgi:hypothetical protein
VINEEAAAIAVTAPYGTNRNGLKPTVIHTGSSVDPASVAAKDFSSPVVCTVTATHTVSTKTTTFTVSVQNNIATPETFTVSGYSLNPAFSPGISGNTHSFTLSVPYAVTSVNLVAAVTANSYGTITAGSGNMPISLATGSGSATIQVTSEDGAKVTTYTLTVTRQGQWNIEISFSGLPMDESTSLSGTASTLDWSDNTAMTVSVPAGNFGGAAYQWYKDGVIWAGKTGSSNTVRARDFSIAMGHQLSVKITTSGGVVWTKSLTFDVVN